MASPLTIRHRASHSTFACLHPNRTDDDPKEGTGIMGRRLFLIAAVLLPFALGGLLVPPQRDRASTSSTPNPNPNPPNPPEIQAQTVLSSSPRVVALDALEPTLVSPAPAGVAASPTRAATSVSSHPARLDSDSLRIDSVVVTPPTILVSDAVIQSAVADIRFELEREDRGSSSARPQPSPSAHDDPAILAMTPPPAEQDDRVEESPFAHEPVLTAEVLTKLRPKSPPASNTRSDAVEPPLPPSLTFQDQPILTHDEAVLDDSTKSPDPASLGVHAPASSPSAPSMAQVVFAPHDELVARADERSTELLARQLNQPPIVTRAEVVESQPQPPAQNQTDPQTPSQSESTSHAPEPADALDPITFEPIGESVPPRTVPPRVPGETSNPETITTVGMCAPGDLSPSASGSGLENDPFAEPGLAVAQPARGLGKSSKDSSSLTLTTPPVDDPFEGFGLPGGPQPSATSAIQRSPHPPAALGSDDPFAATEPPDAGFPPAHSVPQAQPDPSPARDDPFGDPDAVEASIPAQTNKPAGSHDWSSDQASSKPPFAEAPPQQPAPLDLEESPTQLETDPPTATAPPAGAAPARDDLPAPPIPPLSLTPPQRDLNPVSPPSLDETITPVAGPIQPPGDASPPPPDSSKEAETVTLPGELKPPAIPSPNASPSTAPLSAPSGRGDEIPSATTEDGAAFVLPLDRISQGLQDMALTVEVISPEVVNLGKPASLRIIVKNLSTNDAHNVVVRGQLPENLELIDADPTAEQVGRVLIWKLGTMAGKTERTLSVRARAKSVGSFEYAATVTASSGARSRPTSVQEPKLDLKVTPSAAKVLRGRPVQFQIEVSNPGTGVARNVKVWARFSQGLRFARLPQNNGPVLKEIKEILPGESITLTPALEADTVAGGEQSCEVMVESPDVVGGVSGGSVVKTRTIQVIEPMLAVRVSGPEKRYTETIATYELVIENPGTAPASDVKVAVLLPTGGTVRSNGGARYDEKTRRLIWEIPSIDPGRALPLRFDVRLAGIQIYKIAVEASAEGALMAKDTFTTDVVGIADVGFTVTERSRVLDVGNQTQFEIDIRNEGSKEARNVVVRAFISPNLKVLSAGGFKGSAQFKTKTGEVIFPTFERLPPGGRLVLTIDVEAASAGTASCEVVLTHEDLGEVPIRRTAVSAITEERVRRK